MYLKLSLAKQRDKFKTPEVGEGGVVVKVILVAVVMVV